MARWRDMGRGIDSLPMNERPPPLRAVVSDTEMCAETIDESIQTRKSQVSARNQFEIEVKSMASKFKTNLIIALFSPTLIGIAHGATVNASSCAQSAVQTAINSASNGDTVTVPAGSCSWSGLTLPNNKKITLQGAGKDSTIITGSLNFGSSGSRVTGFTFTGNPAIHSEGYGFRLDNCKIQRSSWNNAVSVVNTSTSQSIPVSYGLIDHNDIINGRVNVEGTNAMFADGNQQHALWATDLDLGGPTSVYVEDNTFTNTFGANPCNFIDGNYGGRFVFRYNTINGCVIEAHSSQEGGNRAIRSWEVYGNIINNTGSSQYYPFRIRGGTGMVFYNSVIGNWSVNGIALDNVRSYAAASGGGQCNGSSSWDGNNDSSGYPCRDQIGRSKDNPQWDNSPVGSYTQPLVPAYIWFNRNTSNTELPVNVINNSSNHIKPNRDYYAYTASFSGTTGIGCGTLASRPAMCTPGVGYWATNQSCSSLVGLVGTSPTNPLVGTLYKCTATNTWTAYYTPYTYPHPLTQAGSSVILEAPTVRIIE